MYECPNCGMLPFACVCVPWCYKHNRRDYDPRCRECELDRSQAELDRLRRKAESQARWRARWRVICEFFG